jgi:formylglycine-generating enzyme required for sulfatase activity/tRNA A-37 threonylcarbamoyl transferase component Bud32
VTSEVYPSSSASSTGLGRGLGQLGRYTLLHKLAIGGMAEIFLAKTSGIEGFEKIVVLKRILPHLSANELFVSMFLDEARVAANLEHPNIVNVYDIGKSGEDYFFTMAYLHGEDLSNILREAARLGRGIPLSVALYVVQAVCAGLHYAHEHAALDGSPLGIVHRDVSTTNVLITYDGGVKLLDFGIAKAANQSKMTQVGVRKGKASYMSPEQCRAEPLDRRSDIFAIGILLWELTTMRGLFRADNELAVMSLIAHYDAPLPSTVVEGYPPELEAIVMKALARDREQRYATARELQDDLETFVRDYRLGTGSGELAAMMRELFGPKPLPWAPGGLLAQLGIPLGPTPEPTGAGSSAVISAASSTMGRTPLPGGSGTELLRPGSATEPSPRYVESRKPVSGVRAPLLVGLGVVGALVVGGVAWLALRDDREAAKGDGDAATVAGAGTKQADAADDGAGKAVEPTPPVVPAGPCPEGMVLVEGGSYFMGVESPDPQLASAGPSRKVEVASFCLDRHEVTVAEFHRCSDPGECKRPFLKSHWAEPDDQSEAELAAFSSLCNEGREGVDEHPINCVSWAQADTFCRFRGARLPTEIEWERAARGGDGRPFPWGEQAPGSERLNACGSECLAWFRRSKIGLDAGMFNASDAYVETSAVGSFPQGQGKGELDDLAGNVAEWTADAFAPYPGGTASSVVPEGARVVRGASIHSTSVAEVDPAFRRAAAETWHPHDVGFRCAAEPKK